MGEPLSDAQIQAEEEFLSGMPPLNIGALFMPPIWGPAHGFWITILYYPGWLFADNVFYEAITKHTVMSIIFAVIIFVTLVVVTLVFARLSQPTAAHRAIDSGKMTKEQYIKRQRIWAVCCVILAVIMIILATYYNLVIRPTLG